MHPAVALHCCSLQVIPVGQQRTYQALRPRRPPLTSSPLPAGGQRGHGLFFVLRTISHASQCELGLTSSKEVPDASPSERRRPRATEVSMAGMSGLTSALSSVVQGMGAGGVPRTAAADIFDNADAIEGVRKQLWDARNDLENTTAGRPKSTPSPDPAPCPHHTGRQPALRFSSLASARMSVFRLFSCRAVTCSRGCPFPSSSLCVLPPPPPDIQRLFLSFFDTAHPPFPVSSHAPPSTTQRTTLSHICCLSRG